MKTTDFIKSPLNYVGGKYKLLPQIIPLIPKDISCFVDLFGGGFNVGINVDCVHIIYNDISSQVVDLLKHFYENSPQFVDEQIQKMTSLYNLSRTDTKNNFSEEYIKTQYMRLRDDYSKDPDWTRFYTLVTCAFSNQIRFNSKGEFNMSYGKRYYNASLQEKLRIFVEKMQEKDIQFLNHDFREYDFSTDDFLYCDPPYYNSRATYNENNGWNLKDEEELLQFLDEIDGKGGRFALSNNLKYNNSLLDKWKDKYAVHFLESDYSNCNYHKKDKSKDTEILIVNY